MNGDGEGTRTFDTDIAAIEACETPDQIIEVVNRVLIRASEYSPAVKQLHGSVPIQSISELVLWVQRLKSAADIQASDDALHVFPALYSTLRAAVRRMEAIEPGRGAAEE